MRLVLIASCLIGFAVFAPSTCFAQADLLNPYGNISAGNMLGSAGGSNAPGWGGAVIRIDPSIPRMFNDVHRGIPDYRPRPLPYPRGMDAPYNRTPRFDEPRFDWGNARMRSIFGDSHSPGSPGMFPRGDQRPFSSDYRPGLPTLKWPNSPGAFPRGDQRPYHPSYRTR